MIEDNTFALRRWPSSVRWIVVCSLVAISTFAAGRLLGPRLRSAASTSADLTSQIAPRAGTQLLLVYVGSSRCGACRAPELPGYLSTIERHLRSKARSDSMSFVKIGVASELNAQAGVQHLAAMGVFDEVAAGQGVLNHANSHFVALRHPGLQATPQVIVLTRSIPEAPTGGIDQAGV